MILAQAKRLKIGDRVRYTCEGPDYGDQGTVAQAYATGVEIKWDDGAEIGYTFRNDGYHFLNLEQIIKA